MYANFKTRLGPEFLALVLSQEVLYVNFLALAAWPGLNGSVEAVNTELGISDLKPQVSLSNLGIGGIDAQ